MINRIPYVTTYFSKDDVQLAVRGCCHDFAIAVHRRTGLKLAGIWQDPIIDQHTINKDPMLIHVYCETPEGKALDAEGLVDVKDMIEKYKRDHRDQDLLRASTIGDEKAYADLFEKPECYFYNTLQPRERGVAGAEKVISTSTPFLALLDTFKSAA
jgi:hypothetical protein